MKSRRAAILGFLMTAVAMSRPRQDDKEPLFVTGNHFEEYDLLMLDIETPSAGKIYALAVRYKGREVRITIDELMDALEFG